MFGPTPPQTPMERDISAIRRHLNAMPRIAPPADAYVMDLGDVTFVAAAASTTAAPVWTQARTVTVPAQKRGVVKFLAIDGSTPAAAYFCRFRMTINGSVTLNYQALPYMFSNVSAPAEIYLDVDQENAVALELRNLDTSIGYTMVSRMILWVWDMNIAKGVR